MVDPSLLISSALVAVSGVLVASFTGFVLILWHFSKVSASALDLIHQELAERRTDVRTALAKAEMAEAERQSTIDKLFKEQAEKQDQKNGLTQLDDGRWVDPTDYELDLPGNRPATRNAL